jgi:hypothetical protein
MSSDQQPKEKIPSITDDNDDSGNTDPKPKKEIKFTPDYEAGKPIFRRVFEELSNHNNGLVAFDKLQERLIATGKLDAGGSVLMIEHMEKIGEIEQTEHYHLYRRRMTAPPR